MRFRVRSNEEQRGAAAARMWRPRRCCVKDSAEHDHDSIRPDNDSPAPLPRRAVLRQLGAGGLTAGLLLQAFAGQGNAQSAIASAATEAAARRAINAINQALSSGDMSVLNLSFAPNYVNQTPLRSFTTGQAFSGDLAGLSDALTGLRGVMPNAKLLVEDVIAAGDTAAVRVELRGDIDTTLVTLPDGVAPRLIVGGIVMARIENGLVVESWQYNDAASQLAFAPPPQRQPPGTTRRPPQQHRVKCVMSAASARSNCRASARCRSCRATGNT